jgi:hypothetical protein
MRQRRARDDTSSAGRPACTRRRCARSSGRAVALALLGLCFAASARAQIDLEGCGDVDPAAVAALVSIELDSYGEAARAYRARLACTERTIEIRVDDEITGKRLERSATLAPDDPEPARTIALLVSELVLASWAELALEIVEPDDHDPARVEATRVIERRLRAHPRLSVGAHASAAGRVRDANEPYPTLFVDLAGTLRYEWFGVVAALWIELGSAARTRGDVEHLAFGGSLGPSVVLSLLERLELGMTLSFDLGLVSLEGAPAGARVAGENASALAAAVRFEAALRFLVGVVALAAFLEVGLQLAGLTGAVTGEPDVDPNGLFAGGGVRVALESPR